MCRMLAYLGEPVTLASLLIEPSHSLLRQSWEPRFQEHGVLNADGFGAGWYEPAVRPEPARYRRATPMWSDQSFASIAGVVRSGAVLAAVRDATPGFAVEESATPPFVSGRWLFAHNGLVDGFRDGAGEELRALLSPGRASALESTVDSELLFALTLDRLDAGDAPADALARVVESVEKVSGGRLTMLLTDGEHLAASVAGASLFTRTNDSGITLASEPCGDDADWERAPDRSLVSAGRDFVNVNSL